MKKSYSNFLLTPLKVGMPVLAVACFAITNSVSAAEPEKGDATIKREVDARAREFDDVHRTINEVEVMMDAKGANLEYDTFEIKQVKKAEREKAPAKQKDTSFEYAPTQTKVLQRAIVEDIKVTEDVL